ncbi:flagellar protein FlaG [Paenibacillus sp. BR2-3]|uniref:flagellar protein FlaG n=1 Tax=Paenibacillus sp. BR2-3 TaxID=3048494 RepID=UPI003977C85E
MDIRFAGTSSYNSKLFDSVPIPVSKEAGTDSSEIVKLHSNNELKRMERQGIGISLGEEQVVKALDRTLKALEGPTTSFEVSVHKETNTIMVKVLNKETGELIREIPHEKTLDLVANMMEIAGIIIDERV